MNLSDSITRWIRTAVPVAVGYLLTLLAGYLHIVVDEHTRLAVSGLAMTVAVTGYYSLARWVESRWPKVGVLLLGAPAKPTEPPAA